MNNHDLQMNTEQSVLYLTNTITNKKEIFTPLKEGFVSIYCCGVTVYDLCHLGHARSYIVWDILRRYLIFTGYKVKFVQNFTDIDDKILKKASLEGTSMQEVSERNILEFHKDMRSLCILKPDSMPRATESIGDIKDFISELEDNGHAYSVEGDVYFDVSSFSSYGKLSGRNLLDQLTNADGRTYIRDNLKKKNPYDFALWKSAKDGEPSFSSRWGDGRPGWHIECSAMVRSELGNSIDIHLGGSDLVFPHHENEIAQSECLSGNQLARYWLHNGMVNVQGEKMSKSLGNFKTIRSLLSSGISPMTLRLFVLQAHYRKPIDFTEEALKATSIAWNRLNSALSLGIEYSHIFNNKSHISNKTDISTFKNKFIRSMNDDLNTSESLAVLFDISKPLRSIANRIYRKEPLDYDSLDISSIYARWQLLTELANVLGLQYEYDPVTNRSDISPALLKKIKSAIVERQKAKLNRDYEKADLIRNEMRKLGIDLIDKPSGMTDWVQVKLSN